MSQINSFKIESFGTPSAFDPNSIAEARNSKSSSSSGSGRLTTVYTEETITVSPNTLVNVGGETSLTVNIAGPYSDGDTIIVKALGAPAQVITIAPSSGEIENVTVTPGTFASSVDFQGTGVALTFTYSPNSSSSSAWVYIGSVN